MEFNFSSSAKEVKSESFLKPWAVYDNVSFGGIQGPTTGDKKQGGTWRKWDLVFTCPDGVYKESIFEPSEGGDKRKEIDGQNGGKIKMPSDIDNINLKLQQVISVFMNDENKAKFQKLSNDGKFKGIEFSKFIEVVKKLLVNPKKPSADYPISIKLQGNQNGYARLPYARISERDGVEEAWMERWIGPNLTMSAYEKGKASEYQKAKPTDMSAIDKPTIKDSDLEDLDSLVGEI